MMARPKLRVRKISVVAAPMMEVELPADSDVQGVELLSLQLDEGFLRQSIEIYIVAPEGVPEVLRSAWLVPVDGEVPSAAAEAERLGVVSRFEDKVAGTSMTRPVTCVVLLETQDQARHRHSARRSW